MNAMVKSDVNISTLNKLLKNALTDQIDSREMYLRGIDYSYYYEENWLKDIADGLLINFGSMSLEFKRLYNKKLNQNKI